MALPTLDATFASSADLPRRQMLAKWLVNVSYSGTVEDYYTLPEKYIYAKIAVASGAARSEYDYTSLPDRYTLSDIYKAVSWSSADTIDRGEKEALGWIAAAVRGDAGDPEKVATYINWPWRYQVASIITALAVDADAQSFITTSGATDVEGIDQFVKGVKDLGLWNSMVCWPLRSSQNVGTGTTAYSLGGLGSYNGTLVNGPTWGTDGAVFDGTDDFVFVQMPIFNTSQTFGVVHNNTVTTNTAAMAVSRGGSSQTEFRLRPSGVLQIHSNGQWDQATVDGSFSRSGFSFFLAGWDSDVAQVFVQQNATAISPVSRTFIGTTFNSVHIMSAPATQWTSGTASFAFLVQAKTSSATSIAFYNLYKQTLGTGLSLP